MGWLIALGVLVLLAVLPLGVIFVYKQEGMCLRVTAGPIRFTVLPPKKKRKKEKKPKKIKQKISSKTTSSPQKETEEKGGSLTDFLPLVKIAFQFLGSFRRKLRVRKLVLKLTMAGDDPCDLAVNYGRAWIALGNLMPYLERFFVIGKRELAVQCDFTDDKTSVYAYVHVTITLGRLVALGVGYGVRALIQYFKISNKRKGGNKL